MVEIRITGFKEELDVLTEMFKKLEHVEISRYYPNRNSERMRVYINIHQIVDGSFNSDTFDNTRKINNIGIENGEDIKQLEEKKAEGK